jgi:hypothetical protein
MTPDSDERTVVDPTAFRAVTLTRSFRLTSLAVSRYVRPVAPGIVEHSPPEALQRSHTYETLIG